MHERVRDQRSAAKEPAWIQVARIISFLTQSIEPPRASRGVAQQYPIKRLQLQHHETLDAGLTPCGANSRIRTR